MLVIRLSSMPMPLPASAKDLAHLKFAATPSGIRDQRRGDGEMELSMRR
jgi:hypothetical protein